MGNWDSNFGVEIVKPDPLSLLWRSRFRILGSEIRNPARKVDPNHSGLQVLDRKLRNRAPGPPSKPQNTKTGLKSVQIQTWRKSIDFIIKSLIKITISVLARGGPFPGLLWDYFSNFEVADPLNRGLLGAVFAF